MNPSPSSTPSKPALNNAMPADLVMSYLKKEGYTATEEVFLKELNGIPVNLSSDTGGTEETTHNGESATATATATSLLSTNDTNDDAVTYDVSYKNLREWIENSLDWYKVGGDAGHVQGMPELRSVLFPIFVHAYLDLVQKRQVEQAKDFFAAYHTDHIELHTPYLKRLESIKEPQHVRENELAQIYRNNKYNLRMSSVPFELFLSYLQDNRFMLLLRIVNQYINIQVVHGKLLKSAGGLELDDVIGITGHQSQHLETFNQQPVQLGQAPLDPALKEEIEQALKDEDHLSNKDENTENADASMTTSLLELFKKVTQEESVNGPAMNDIPLPPYRGTDVQAQVNLLKDMGKRLPLGHDSLPSICCYTFHNTYDNLNCLTVTKDASLVAGGFSDSFVKIWSLKGEKLKGFRNTINPAYVNDYDDLNRQKERVGSDFKKLVGHSNSVYGVSFSPDNKYLLSCSADKTARLWSTQTYTNLVIYKGHNYPLWDVEFGPFGFYFATASHDRTARLWSCDQIYPLRVFAGHLSDVDVVKFHPNSKYVVTGSSDRTARMWDVQTGKTVRVFTGHRGAIKAVAMSPNGQLMASAGDDNSILLWDLSTGRKIKTMTGHTDIIYSLRFSMDNNVLVSGGADDTVRVWDVNQDNMDVLADGEAKMEPKRRRLDQKAVESNDHLGCFPTKHTPIYDVQFTNRNLCLAAGAFKPSR